MQKKTWVIAGATSAIALQFAHQVAKQGHQVVLLARDNKKLAVIQADLVTRYQVQVNVLQFDAAAFSTHEALVSECVALANYPISILLAFGFMVDGPAGSHTASDAVRVTNVNYTGVVSLSFLFLPHFKKQKQGHILVLGSVAGDRGRASNFDYGAAKAALVPFCEGLRATLINDNVSVTLMKLGFIDTPMTQGKAGVFLAASPEDCAAACLRAAEKKVTQKYFPWFWCWIMLVFKLLPGKILYKLNV